MTEMIALDQAEQAMLNGVVFDVLTLKDRAAVLRNANIACALAKALIERGAILKGRMRYLTAPEYNVGGRGKSRLQSFKDHGNRGDDILKHPHFLPYLRYFIYGAELPAAARTRFIAAVENCGGVTSGDILPLGALARSLIRSLGLDGHKACDEFFKLAIDLDLSVMTATALRTAARGR